MPLFAATDEQTAGLVGLAMIVGGAIQWGLTQLNAYLDKRRKESKEDEAGTLDEYRELLEREKETNRAEQAKCDQRVTALERRLDARDRRLRVMTIVSLTLIGWVRYALTMTADGKPAKLEPPKGLDDLEAMIRDDSPTPVPEAPK